VLGLKLSGVFSFQQCLFECLPSCSTSSLSDIQSSESILNHENGGCQGWGEIPPNHLHSLFGNGLC